MSLYKRGRLWWISMWRGGKHILVSTKFTDKRKARQVEAVLKSAGVAENGAGERLDIRRVNDSGREKDVVVGLLRAIYGDSGKQSPLDGVWDEYVEILRVKGKSESAKGLRDKHSCLNRFISWANEQGVTHLGQVKGDQARGFALMLAETIPSAKRRKNVIMHLSAIWNLVLANHEGVINPWRMVSPSNVKSMGRGAFTALEEQRVLAACKEVHPQWFVASVVARYTGLRYGDVCRLTWGEVDMERRLIAVKPSKTKDSSGVVVVIPMSKTLYTVMRGWEQERARHTPNDRVLPWLREKGPKEDKRFSVVLKRAGLDCSKYSFHSWRHTFRSALAAGGVSTEIAMKLCGHTTREMSAHYDHFDHLEELRTAVSNAESVGR